MKGTCVGLTHSLWILGPSLHVLVWNQQIFHIHFPKCFPGLNVVWVFSTCTRPQWCVCQVPLFSPKHSLFITVRPSPAANHSVLFDYSAEAHNKTLHYDYVLLKNIYHYGQDLYDVFKGQLVQPRWWGCSSLRKLNTFKCFTYKFNASHVIISHLTS